MTDPIPINLAALESRQAMREAKELTAKQVISNERLEEGIEMGFNPQAVAREQARLNRFRSLENRSRTLNQGKEKKIQEVGKKAEEDLSQQFSRRNPELDPDRLRRLRASLKEGMSPQEILDEVQASIQDPTLADEAMEFLEISTTGLLQENVKAARALLFNSKAREIIAGRNIAPAVKAFHGKGLADSPTELRNLYRDITGAPREHNLLFSELSSKYSFDNLKLVVAFLLKGLGFDLKSKGPSIQQAELVLLMTETRKLQSILWVYLFFKGRTKSLKALFAKYGLKFPKGLTFELLAQEFIKLVEERYPTALKLLKQAEKMGLIEDDEKILVLNQYRDAMRALSLRLYRNPKQRQDLLLIILETLEDLEEKDEEESE